MEVWVYWAVATVLLVISEIFIPGFWVSVFSLGTLFASVTAGLFTDSLKIQLIVFSVFSLLGFIVVRPLALKYMYKKSEPVKTNVDAMSGKRAVVTEEINNDLEKGRVKLGSEYWMARSENGDIIKKDETVEVVRVDGAKVFVKLYDKN